jgi:hypothetical protein
MKSFKVITRAAGFLVLGAMLALPAWAGKISIADKVSAGSWADKSGIQIAPLYLNKTDSSISFLSLDEATKQDLIEVMETSDVNQLLVENKGKKPILLLAGEVVGGGKQDRMVGKDLILGPGKIRRIAVFCVEHGRWTSGAEKTEFKSASVMADKEIRQKAQKEGGSAGNQSGVWDEVSKSLGAYKASAPTSNYREIMKTEKFKDSEPIVQYFIETFDDDPDLAGFALAYNGEVQSLEYFANPALLSKYREKLIRSYVASALKGLSESKPVSLAALSDFAGKSLEDDTHRYKNDDEIVIESSGKDLESFELQTLKSALVHYSRYQKQ